MLPAKAMLDDVTIDVWGKPVDAIILGVADGMDEKTVGLRVCSEENDKSNCMA